MKTLLLSTLINLASAECTDFNARLSVVGPDPVDKNHATIVCDRPDGSKVTIFYKNLLQEVGKLDILK